MLLLLAVAAQAGPPQRIISGMPSTTEMLFALGLSERIVGVSSNCNYPPAALTKERVGGFHLNLEKVVSLKPDLIVMLASAQRQDIERFEDFGLPVHTIDPMSIAEVMIDMLELGELTGTVETAEAVVKEMRRRLMTVEAEVGDKTPKRVLVVIGLKPLIVVGGGNFIDDVIGYANADNVAAGAKAAYPQYSFEKLLAENPDYIIILEGLISRQTLARDRRWQSLAAVREGRVLSVDADVLSRPGPRVVEAVENIAEFIHEKEDQE